MPEATALISDVFCEAARDGATLAAVEGLAAGRVASGERWAAARCQTRLRVRREGALLLDDALLLALPGLEEVVVETGEGEVRTLRRTRPGADGDADSAPAPATGDA